MYLRAENEDEAAREREALWQARLCSLEESLEPTPSWSDADKRLELAAMLHWRGIYHPVLELLRPLTDSEFPTPVVAQARQLIADAHFRHDQYDLANRQYHENLEIARAQGDEYWAARAKDGIGWVLIEVGHYTSGEFADAHKVFAETLPVYQKNGKPLGEAMALQGLSRAYAGAGDYDRALQNAEQAITVFRENGRTDYLQLPLIQMAMIYRDYGSFHLSDPMFEAAIDAADWSQDRYSQVTAALGYGCLLGFLSRKEESRKIWQRALTMADRHEFPRLAHEISVQLANDAVDREDFRSAYEHQTAGQRYGSQIGVVSPLLNNQHLLLRNQLHHTQHLQDALAHLTAGIEASVDGIFVLGEPQDNIAKGDFVIRFVNACAAEMLGRRPVDILHVMMGEVWRSPTAALLQQPSRRVWETGELCTLDPVQLEFKEGHPQWYSVKIAPIRDGVAWTVSDVTKREEMQREILAQRDRLEEANTRLVALDREKTEMMAIAAHDIRGPVGNIYSISRSIASDEPETRRWLGVIEAASESLLAILGNLLDVERIERGELSLDLQPIEVSLLLEEVVEQFSARAREKRIGLKLDLPIASAWARADVNSFRQTVQNLVSNALKFSPMDSTVEIRLSVAGRRLRIEIRDEGPGISPEDQDLLFGKFVRLSSRPTDGESSTGLGLSIVKRLVEAMDGEVGCISTLGQGTTFWIEFPALSLREAMGG
ncbi:hypothetical protein EON79_04235 [bacterium]|nr:MAG: hypothetical protein EON79_04235 [bacterium]